MREGRAPLTLSVHYLRGDQQRRVEDVRVRTLPALGDHVLTAELDAGLAGLVLTPGKAGRIKTATVISAAHTELAATVGKLNSRSTRVSNAQ